MRKYILLIVWLSGLFFAFGQEPTKEDTTDSLIDDFFYSEDAIIDDLINSLKKYQFLYVSVAYNSDTYFAGRDIGIDQFNIAPQLTYANSNGLYASLSGIYYSEFEPQWDVTTASLGFSKNFGKQQLFKYNVSFSKYFYANDADNIFSNTLNLGLGVRSKDRSIGTQITGSFLFGDEQSFQISSRSYVSINLVKNKKMTLKFRPQLNIIAGKQTIELTRVYIENREPVVEYIENDIFDVINTQINIPLQLNLNSFDVELGYNLNLPSAIGTEDVLDSTGFFNLTLSYLIDL